MIKKPPIGTKVEVWSEDETEYFGIGEIVDYERVTTLGEIIWIDQDTPIIMLRGGIQIRGHECVYDVYQR